MRKNFISPRGIPLFEDASLCLQVITKLRFERGCICPRCESKDVRFQHARRRIHGSFTCQNCNYDFSATSGTFFMGARLPLTSYLQMLTLHDALGDSLPPFEACLAIGTTNQSVVSGILRRLRLIDPMHQFTTIDRGLAAQLRLYPHLDAESEVERFFLYCEAKSILVNEPAFLEALDIVANTRVPGLVESYKRRGQLRGTKQSIDRQESKRTDLVKEPVRSRGDQNSEVGLRKDIAKRWIDRLGEALPNVSTRLRTRMAWQLASIGVESDEMLAQVEPGALMNGSGLSSSLVILRDQYLSGRGLSDHR